MSLPATPPQTIGPFFHIMLDVSGTGRPVSSDDPDAVRIEGRVLDGAGQAVGDALIELWDAGGARFARCATDGEGHVQEWKSDRGPFSGAAGLHYITVQITV